MTLAQLASRSGLVGDSPSRLRKWRKALANVRSGTADAKVLCIGDSTTTGVGISGNIQGLPGAYPYILASMLNASGLPSARGLGIPGKSGNSDSRWTIAANAGAGWYYLAGYAWGANGNLNLASGINGTLVYTDAVLADRYDVYYLQNTGLATMDITATGGSTVTQATVGTAGVNKVTASAAAAATTNTVSIARNTSGALHIIGIEPWLSTTKQVRIANAGVGGSAASDWAGNGSSASFRSTVCIQAYAPDLTIISLGINDANSAASVSTWHTNLATLIAAAQVSGDVVIVPPLPCMSTATANRVANPAVSG